MDGGGGFVHVPENCGCLYPNDHTLYRCSFTHLLGYVGDNDTCNIHILIFVLIYSGPVGSSRYSFVD